MDRWYCLCLPFVAGLVVGCDGPVAGPGGAQATSDAVRIEARYSDQDMRVLLLASGGARVDLTATGGPGPNQRGACVAILIPVAPSDVLRLANVMPMIARNSEALAARDSDADALLSHVSPIGLLSDRSRKTERFTVDQNALGRDCLMRGLLREIRAVSHVRLSRAVCEYLLAERLAEDGQRAAAIERCWSALRFFEEWVDERARRVAYGGILEPRVRADIVNALQRSQVSGTKATWEDCRATWSGVTGKYFTFNVRPTSTVVIAFGSAELITRDLFSPLPGDTIRQLEQAH